MNIIRMLSWNVNGLRAINKKGFRAWLEQDAPDILCIQETKVKDDQVPLELKSIPGFYSYFSSGDKKGYGGVGLFTRKEPNDVSFRLALENFNDENRVIKADFGSFVLFNVYFPNGKASNERLKYKLKFYDGFLDIMDNLKAQGRNIVICGDFNTAHEKKDLARPKQNEKISGFLT